MFLSLRKETGGNEHNHNRCSMGQRLETLPSLSEQHWGQCLMSRGELNRILAFTAIKAQEPEVLKSCCAR